MQDDLRPLASRGAAGAVASDIESARGLSIVKTSERRNTKSSKAKKVDVKATGNSVITKVARRTVRLKSALRAGKFATSGE